ncbi:MAG: C-5 cytosine-specific DNA methylase [Candidatus Nitrotoga sp. SPKER]|nr:MAG: C-5 cytosine-specific DNA methylase [Candidatus Nitrotoga sp. SPKER]
MDNKPPEKCEPEDFLVKAEKYGIPQARHRMLILGIREDIHITPETLQESEATTVAQVIGDLPKIRSTVSKEPDTLELWREILGSMASEAWYRKGQSNGLSQTVEKINEALVTIQKRRLMAGTESMSYTGRPKIFPDWYRHGCVDVLTNHAGRGLTLPCNCTVASVAYDVAKSAVQFTIRLLESQLHLDS